MQGNDVAAINAAIDKLTAASHKLAEAMYKSTSGPGGTPPGGGQPGPGDSGDGGQKKKDDVVDAEFVDVDDKK
jgi:molecular chaperone DnaK